MNLTKYVLHLWTFKSNCFHFRADALPFKKTLLRSNKYSSDLQVFMGSHVTWNLSLWYIKIYWYGLSLSSEMWKTHFPPIYLFLHFNFYLKSPYSLLDIWIIIDAASRKQRRHEVFLKYVNILKLNLDSI